MRGSKSDGDSIMRDSKFDGVSITRDTNFDGENFMRVSSHVLSQSRRRDVKAYRAILLFQVDGIEVSNCWMSIVGLRDATRKGSLEVSTHSHSGHGSTSRRVSVCSDDRPLTDKS